MLYETYHYYKKYSSSYSTTATEETVKSDNYYSQTENYEGFNALWGVGAGIQYSRFRLDIGGEFGMVNKASNSGSITAHWTKPVYVTLTCFF